ncbi:uncharacterized protein [Centruroides vittatus]|uniref:uncharacterized protein n=1 Tax=Centruroides vittatus TaxID=120091 RepID=UPI003510292E
MEMLAVIFTFVTLTNSEMLNISSTYIPQHRFDVNDHANVSELNLWKWFSVDDILDKISLNKYLLKVVDNFRNGMRKGMPSLKIPVLEPFSPPEINVKVNDSKANLHIIIRDLKVYGLSNFIVDYLDTSIKHLNMSFVFRVLELNATGYYYINGRVIKIIPLRGNGSWWLQMDNLTMSASASLDITDKEKFRMGKRLEVKMDFQTVRMNFENLLGDGNWVRVVIKLLNDLSRTLFHKFQPLLAGKVKEELRKIVNKEFDKMPIKAIRPGSTANEYMDQILANVKEQIIHHNLEPMELPDYIYNFSKKVMFIEMNGEAKLYDGLLIGASSIHRTGDCILNVTESVAVLGAHLGLRDLNITYKGHAKFMSMGPSIKCGGHVASVAFYIEIQQSNAPGSHPVLTALEVIDMSTIWIELSGLGPLTWIMKWLLTGLTKLMEDFLIEKVTSYIKEYVEEQLSRISFPIGK